MACVTIITNILMVIITSVYVYFTIMIFKENKNAVEVANKQIKEMQKQFNESNRPRIEVEFIYEKRAHYGLRFKNNGNLTAQQVSIVFDDSFIDSIDESPYSELLKEQIDKECVIGVGQHHDVYIGSNKLRDSKKEIIASGKVIYFNNDNKYDDDIFYIDINNYMTIYSVDTEQEELLKEIKKQNNILKEQKTALSSINQSLRSIKASSESAEQE